MRADGAERRHGRHRRSYAETEALLKPAVRQQSARLVASRDTGGRECPPIRFEQTLDAGVDVQVPLVKTGGKLKVCIGIRISTLHPSPSVSSPPPRFRPNRRFLMHRRG